jgi:D-alanyl-D-alanine carboxypeptidase/D-alanyl-D-alanine-endopeptidase (penicillin-binding protein 4)
MKKTYLVLVRLALVVCVAALVFANASNVLAKQVKPAIAQHKDTVADAATDAALTSRLKSAVKASGFKDGEIGLWVGINGSEGLETLFSQGGDRLMLPASLSKIMTASAVMDVLRPDFKFKTMLLGTNLIENGKLKGPLYLKGGGDPSFVSENMWFLVNELTRAGITSIDGDIVVDDSRFDKIRFGDDRQEERVDRAYDAPIGAMSLNWNSVSVYARPGDKVGDKLKVFVDISSPYIKLKNETRTAVAGHGKTIEVERSSEKDFNGDVITVSGALALDQPEAVVYKSISQPDLFSGYALLEFLGQRGITVKGAVRNGDAPANATVLATEESKPLSLIVADMAKWSNNYVAEMLVKNLSVEKGNQPGTMASGLVQVRGYLENLGFKSGEYEFLNAAGFTRKNRLSPMQLGRVLEHVHDDFRLFPEFVTALPIAGIDGTLRKRMKNSAAEHWVRAKTGLLNGAVGLAGFAGQPNGKVMTFAFIYNGSGREDKARAFFDHLAAVLVEE